MDKVELDYVPAVDDPGWMTRTMYQVLATERYQSEQVERWTTSEAMRFWTVSR